jgi:hypothetical protein
MLKSIAFALLLLFVPSVLVAGEETVRIGGVDIVVPIPDGFVSAGKVPRDLSPAEGLSITRFVDHIKLIGSPPTKVQMLNVQATTEDQKQTLTDEEFKAREAKYRDEITETAEQLGLDKNDLSFFTGDGRFGYTLFRITPKGSGEGHVAATMLVKGKVFAVNYLSVAGDGNELDWVRGTQAEAEAFFDAILSAN